MACLPDTEWQRWLPHLTLVDLPLGQVLHESGQFVQHVYFPLDATVSLMSMLEDGSSTEISLVGKEGMVGIAILMGGESTTSSAVVHSAGIGLKIPGQVIKTEIHRSVPVMHLLLRYTQALITQMAQTAVCNRHHSVDQQLCRWLLMNMDRVPGGELSLTQELIANMLGVRREALQGQRLDLFVSSTSRPVLRDLLDRVRQQGGTQSCTLVVQMQDKSARTVCASACPDPGGDDVLLVFSARADVRVDPE